MNLSHGMADLANHRNADRDIQQVGHLFYVKVLIFQVGFLFWLLLLLLNFFVFGVANNVMVMIMIKCFVCQCFLV